MSMKQALFSSSASTGTPVSAQSCNLDLKRSNISVSVMVPNSCELWMCDFEYMLVSRRFRSVCGLFWSVLNMYWELRC